MDIRITRVDKRHILLEDIDRSRVDTILQSLRDGHLDPACLEDLFQQYPASSYTVDDEETGDTLWPESEATVDTENNTWHYTENSLPPKTPGVYLVLLRVWEPAGITVAFRNEPAVVSSDYWNGSGWQIHRTDAIMAWGENKRSHQA